jgi:hypothetical protein
MCSAITGILSHPYVTAHHHCMHARAQTSEPVPVISRQGWPYYRQALTIYQYGPHPFLGDGILDHQFSMNGGHVWSIFLCSFYYVWALHRVLSSAIQYAWRSNMLCRLYRKVKQTFTVRSDLLTSSLTTICIWQRELFFMTCRTLTLFVLIRFKKLIQ